MRGRGSSGDRVRGTVRGAGSGRSRGRGRSRRER